MHKMRALLLIAFLIPKLNGVAAEPTTPPARLLGDWVMINGLLVLHVSEDGVLVVRNTSQMATLKISPDDTFIWELKAPISGKFSGSLLLLKNPQNGVPPWMEYLEFRKTTKQSADEVLAYAQATQNDTAKAWVQFSLKSFEREIRTNLITLDVAAQQFLADNKADPRTYDDLVGRLKYIKELKVVDGEDYRSLDFSASTRTWEVRTKSGLIVRYER